MKKTTIVLLLLALIAGLFISCSQEMTVDADVHNKINDIDTFCINGKYFSTLQAAVDYFKDSKAMKAPGDNDNVIYLTRNASGPGADIVDIQGLVIDFAGFTYSFTNVTAIQGETGGKFGLSITEGSEVTLKGLEQIDLFDSTADLTMVYIEGSDTSLTIEDAPKMVVEPTQYVFWAANGATLTIGSTDATKEAAITGKIAATGGTTEESKPTITVKAKTTITGDVEATKAEVTLSGKTVVTGTVSATESKIEANETSKVTGKIEASASKVSVSGAAKIEVDLTAKDNSQVVINTVETGAEASVIKTMDKQDNSIVVVAGGSVNVDEVAAGSDGKIEVADGATVVGDDVQQETVTSYVAKINGKSAYATMEEAIEAASTTGHRDEIILLQAITEDIEIPHGKDVIINLNSYDLGTDASHISVTVYGSVIVRAESEDKVYGEMHLKSGSDTMLESGEYIIDNPSTAVEEGAELTITGGTYNFDPASFVPAYCDVQGTGPTWTVVRIAQDDAVAEISGNYYKALQTALDDASSGDTIKLLKDVTITQQSSSSRVPITKSVILDGDNKTVSINGRGFGVGMNATSKIDVTFRNITINNSSQAGRCIDTRGNLNSLTLDNVTLSTDGASGTTQPLTIGGNQEDSATIYIKDSTIKTNDDATAYYAIITFNPVDITIDNTTLKGWACLYLKGPDGSAGSHGSNIVIKNNSKLYSRNIYSGTSNAFGAIVFDDSLGSSKVTIENSNIDIEANSDQYQAVACYSKSFGIVELKSGVVMTATGEKAIFQLNDPAEGQGVLITGGTYNEDPSAYVAEGYYAKPQGTNPETWIVIPDTPQVSVVKNGESVGQIMSLALFRDKVNAGNTYEGYTITLLVDVDLENVAWTPIGTAEHPFSGTFDGNSKTITGLTVSANGNLGLFGVSQDSELKNFTIDNANISGSGNDSALVSGKAFRTTISGVNVINSTLNMVEGERIGGITGGAYTIIINCSVKNCSITGSEQVGAIAGYICSEPITGCVATDNTIVATVSRAGGLVGKLDFGDNVEPATVSNNTISGTVTAPDVAGGICGQIMCGTSHVNDYSIAGNSMDIECTADKTSPIGILRSGQPIDFTGTMATKITGNKWTARTYNMNTYTYTAEETGTTAQVIVNAM